MYQTVQILGDLSLALLASLSSNRCSRDAAIVAAANLH